MDATIDRDYMAALRAHGLQVTYQRLAIYEALHSSKEHPSTEDIYQRVKRRFPMISLGTVYKTLERFHDVGLVQKVGLVTDVARYDANVNARHYLVCMKCQKIQAMEDPELDVKIAGLDGKGFRVLRHQVLLQGLCSECRKAGAIPST